MDYTNRDFDSIKQDLINSIPKYTDKWTDRGESDLGMIWLTQLAGVSAMLNYYIDKEAAECKMDSVQEPKNLMSMLEMFSYKRPLKHSAIATGVIEVPFNADSDSRLAGDIVIPAWTRFYIERDSDYSNINFTNPEPIVVKPIETKVTFPLKQGNFITNTFDISNLSDYKIYLPSNDVSDDFFELNINGEVWEQVENAFLELQGGKVYSLHRDAYNNCYILLSHDFRMYLPTQGNYTISYLDTLGEINIPPKTVNKIEFTIKDPETGTDITQAIKIYNDDYFTGGFTDNDLIFDKAKTLRYAKLPKYLTKIEHFKDWASSYPGVADAQAIDMSIKGAKDIKPYEVRIFILMHNNQPMSAEFKAEIEDAIKLKQSVVSSIKIEDVKRINVDIDLSFTVKSEAINLRKMELEIQSYLYSLYDTPSFARVFNKEIMITKLLQKFPDIFTIDVHSPTKSVVPDLGEIVEISSISVSGSYYTYTV